jgi:hypothetical protein
MIKSLLLLTLSLPLFGLSTATHTPEIHKRSHRRLADPLLADTGLDVNETSHSVQSRAILPSGWALYVANGNDGGGCYVDTNPRVLSGFSVPQDNSNGIAKCINACVGRGFKYAGVEYGSQCYVSRNSCFSGYCRPVLFPGRLLIHSVQTPYPPSDPPRERNATWGALMILPINAAVAGE